MDNIWGQNYLRSKTTTTTKCLYRGFLVGKWVIHVPYSIVDYQFY